MNGFSWSTGISQGGLGFPGLSSSSVVVAWIFDPIIATGGLGVDRHDDGPAHGRGGVPILISDGFELDLGCRHRSAKI